MIIAQGKRGTSATPGKHDPKNYPSPRESASGERDNRERGFFI